jgi:hypothetical protein
MKRSRAILVLAVVLLLVLVPILLFVFLSPNEPVYEGRPIGQWIEQMSGSVDGTVGAVSSQELPKLIQQEPGADVAPFLGGALHRGRPFGARLYARWYGKLPNVVAQRLHAPNPARDAELRYRAALILYYMGPKGKKAVPDLIYALGDENQEARRMAATALGAVGADSESAALALSTALGDPVAEVRQAAVKSLGQSTNDTAGTALKIAGALKDADAGVRVEAAQILKNLGPKAKGVVPALIQALRDPEQDVVLFAAQALGRIGPDARDAAPALQEALQNAAPNSETTLRWALKQTAGNIR